MGLRNFFIKDESRNPTGSFIDRGATVIVTLARRRGVVGCSCVTTGNLGASLAAYCAKAGLGARIRINPSADRGKLYQMLAYGADLEAGGRKRGETLDDPRTLQVDAGNPYLLEGEKTTCFEIAQDMGWNLPEVIVVPVGTGGHLSMVWRGICQLRDAGLVGGSKCRLIGVHLPIPKDRSETPPFTELEESEPFFADEASRAVRDSGGVELTTSVEGAVRATGLLARTEGIFAEPASASAVAALGIAISSGVVDRDETVVCIITSAGLKDTKAVTRLAREARRLPMREEPLSARTQVGETKLELMRLLLGRGAYGYQLWQSLAASRRISTASVYQHLSELESMGLVKRDSPVTARGRERVPYQLTRRGGDYLKFAGKLERVKAS